MAVGLAVVALAILGYVDAITGPELSLAFCYLVPVIAATWLAGRGAGFLTAVASAGTWLLAERHGAEAYAPPWVAYWNAAIRLAFFLLAAALLARFKELRDHLHIMVEARTQTLRRLAAQLSEAEDTDRPICLEQVQHDEALQQSPHGCGESAAQAPNRARCEHGGSHVTMINAYGTAPRHLVRRPQLRPGMLEKIGVTCGSAGLFLLALGIVAGVMLAVVVSAPYFLLRSWLPSRRIGGCSYCRAGLPPARKNCPGCGRSC